MAERAKLKDRYGLEEINQHLDNVEIIKNAQERLVHPKDMDHETIPTTNHIQLMLDNIKKAKGTRSDLADELLKVGYKKDVVRKIMDSVDMYEF
jgi:hypothetical protein